MLERCFKHIPKCKNQGKIKRKSFIYINFFYYLFIKFSFFFL